MKIFDQLYVGVKDDGQGFMVPHENNASSRKREETVNGWLGCRYDPSPEDLAKLDIRIMPNDPQFGFKLSGSASRHSTSNKVVKIDDPRGFVLELYIPALFRLISEVTMVNGAIKEELIWTRNGTNNELVKVGGEYHNEIMKEQAKPKISSVNVVPGDIIEANWGSKFTYLGKMHVQMIAPYRVPDNRGYRSYSARVVKNEEAVSLTSFNEGKLHVYSEELSAYDIREGNQQSFHVRKGPIKATKLLGSVATIAMPSEVKLHPCTNRYYYEQEGKLVKADSKLQYGVDYTSVEAFRFSAEPFAENDVITPETFNRNRPK